MSDIVTINKQNFTKFKKQLEKLNANLDDSARRVVNSMAYVGLEVTKKNTPEITGWLRNNWIKNKTRKVGGSYTTGYSNNVEYGVYVNNGRRVVNKSGETLRWKNGKRMLEQGMNEVKRQLYTLFQNEVARVKRKTGF